MKPMRGARAGLLALVTLLFGGCTDVCDRAIVLLDRECGIDTTRDPDEMCEGDQKRVSECIVEHPDDACDYYYDPVAESDNPFAVCAFGE
jgi:hypothetical protein